MVVTISHQSVWPPPSSPRWRHFWTALKVIHNLVQCFWRSIINLLTHQRQFLFLRKFGCFFSKQIILCLPLASFGDTCFRLTLLSSDSLIGANHDGADGLTLISLVWRVLICRTIRWEFYCRFRVESIFSVRRNVVQ